MMAKTVRRIQRTTMSSALHVGRTAHGPEIETSTWCQKVVEVDFRLREVQSKSTFGQDHRIR